MSEKSMMVKKGDTSTLFSLAKLNSFERQRWITNNKKVQVHLFDSPPQKYQQRMLASFLLLLQNVWFLQIFELHQKLEEKWLLKKNKL